MTAAAIRSRRHGPLQVEPPRHRVQPLRGARPRPALRHGSVRRHGRRHGQGRPRRADPAGRERTGRVLRRHRPQPAGLRPRHQHRAGPRHVQEELRGLHGRRVLAARPARGDRRHHRAPLPDLVVRRTGARFEPGDLDVLLGSRLRRHPLRRGHRAAEEDRRARGREAVGLDHGAHRAGRGLRRRRRAHQGGPAGRRQLAHRGRQALHHLGRARHVREHHPLRAGPPRGRGTRHQGPVAVHGAQVRVRRRDRRAGRAQRRLRHQRRAQDGPEGVQHLRDDLRRQAPRQGLADRRQARRHPADVPDHRVRPHDGRHEGDRHTVHRLPERSGVRQGAGPGTRPGAVHGQGRAQGHHHPPPRRAALADDAEGVRRGHARARPLHRLGPGLHPGRRGRGRGREAGCTGSTTCCCPS